MDHLNEEQAREHWAEGRRITLVPAGLPLKGNGMQVDPAVYSGQVLDPFETFNRMISGFTFFNGDQFDFYLLDQLEDLVREGLE